MGSGCSLTLLARQAGARDIHFKAFTKVKHIKLNFNQKTSRLLLMMYQQC